MWVRTDLKKLKCYKHQIHIAFWQVAETSAKAYMFSAF